MFDGDEIRLANDLHKRSKTGSEGEHKSRPTPTTGGPRKDTEAVIMMVMMMMAVV